MSAADPVLNSWKDIAGHLHTSVRTAQRWEMHFHLPIHRPSGTHKGPVLAFEHELDTWIQNGGAAAMASANGCDAGVASQRSPHGTITPQAKFAHERAQRMYDLAAEITRRTQALREQLERAMATQSRMEPGAGWGKANRSSAIA